MHLCCGRTTKQKKSKETSRSYENASRVSVRNNSSTMYGEVKQSKLKEEADEDETASDAVSAGQTLALLHSAISCEEISSALRDDLGGRLSTFGKVVPHEVSPKKQESMENSDYDNTTIFNYRDNISPDVACLSAADSTHLSDADKGSENKCSAADDMTFNSASIPNEADRNFPTQTSKPSTEANILELDSVLALMLSMTSSSKDGIPPTPVQRSCLLQHGSDEDEAPLMTSSENSSAMIRRKTTESSADEPRILISTERKTSSDASLLSPSSQFVVDTSVDGEIKPHSATPVRLNPSYELSSQDTAAAADDDDGTSGCLSRVASLTPVSSSSSVAAIYVLQAATKAKDDENSNNTDCLDHYSIQENTKYSDPINLDINSPPQRPCSSSSLSSGMVMQTETGTGSTKAEEATDRTSENQTYFESATEDSLCEPYQRRNLQINCFTSETELCPALTASGVNVSGDSSDANQMACDVAMSSASTLVDQFKSLRLDVLKATSKLLDFVGEIWRRQESLNGKLSKISLLCLHLKTGLQELENFGLSLLSHLSEEERLTSEKKLFSHLKLLQNIRNGINRYLESLEGETLSEHMESLQQHSDESLRVKVGNIILLTKVIPGLVRTFGSFVDDIVKADFSNKPVVDSERDNSSPKVPSSDTHHTEDSRTIAADLNAEDRYLTCENDYRTNSTEENPPAIPPKSFHSAKTTEDRQMLYANNSNCGEDLLRATPCSESPSYSESTTTIIAAHQSADGSAVRKVSDDLEGSGSDSLEEGPPSVVFRRKRPTSPAALHSTLDDSSNDGRDLESRFSTSELVTPDIRSSGISLTVQTRLEELQRQATSQSVLLHTDADCGFTDYDLPAGIMDENLPNLCEHDCKLLLYYSDEMFSHWRVLDSAASAFFQCMEMSQLPKIFLMHSKFVLVAGHKMAYIGDVLARNVTDEEARDRLMAFSNDLCERLKHAVRATKAAALAFPAVKPLQLMVDDIKVVTDSAYELRELLFRLAYLGRAEQSFSW